jgi:phage recombination protein Bet
MAKKKKHTKKHAKKKKRAPVVEVLQPTGIVRVEPRAIERGPRLRQADVELLRRTVAKGTTDDEFALFLWVAKKHRLDPMTRQIHAIKRQVQKHHQDAKGIWHAGAVMTIQVGIDGYRALAARHKDYGGSDDAIYTFDKPGDKQPASATIKLWKRGLEHPVVATAYWNEFAPADLTRPEMFMWAKMPKHMLAKCAEALALRKGYPDLSDIYTDEEMAQADQDYTDSGRQIVLSDGKAPSGVQVQHVWAPGEKHLTVQQQEVADAHEAELKKKMDEQMAQIAKEKDMNKATKQRDDNAIHNPENLAPHQISASPSQVAKAAAPTAAPREEAEKPAAPPRASRRSSSDALTVGLIQYARPESSPNKGIECLRVNWAGYVVSCFDKKLWPYLGAAVGLEAELFLADNKQKIIGIKRIGKREFEGGQVPIISMNEERIKGISRELFV